MVPLRRAPEKERETWRNQEAFREEVTTHTEAGERECGPGGKYGRWLEGPLVAGARFKYSAGKIGWLQLTTSLECRLERDS